MAQCDNPDEIDKILSRPILVLDDSSELDIPSSLPSWLRSRMVYQEGHSYYVPLFSLSADMSGFQRAIHKFRDTFPGLKRLSPNLVTYSSMVPCTLYEMCHTCGAIYETRKKLHRHIWKAHGRQARRDRSKANYLTKHLVRLIERGLTKRDRRIQQNNKKSRM